MISFCLLTPAWPCELWPCQIPPIRLVDAVLCLVLKEVDVSVGWRPRPFFLFKLLFVCSQRRNLTVDTLNWSEHTTEKVSKLTELDLFYQRGYREPAVTGHCQTFSRLKHSLPEWVATSSETELWGGRSFGPRPHTAGVCVLVQVLGTSRSGAPGSGGCEEWDPPATIWSTSVSLPVCLSAVCLSLPVCLSLLTFLSGTNSTQHTTILVLLSTDLLSLTLPLSCSLTFDFLAGVGKEETEFPQRHKKKKEENLLQSCFFCLI